ncbi:hypothetical protein KY284_010609 [Solanum tuberosum]|nr:hypothetical protein KY284_010609 [Solanum tuberosum]
MRNEEINPVMEAKETNDSGKILQVMQSSNGINHGRKTTQELQHQRKLQWRGMGYTGYTIKGSGHWV